MIDVLILAAGKGTRMKTDKPKALVPLAGKPLLEHVLRSVEALNIRPYLIVGHKGEDILALFEGRVNPIWQKEQKGTGHAVMIAGDILKKNSAQHVVVLSADQPLVRPESIQLLIEAREKSGAAFSMATVSPEHHNGDYAGFQNMGRIVRDAGGAIQAIVEYKNADDTVRSLKEVNITTYCFDPMWLWENLVHIGKNSLSGEYYLTDLVTIARAQGKKVIPVILPTREGAAANTLEELSIVERLL